MRTLDDMRQGIIDDLDLDEETFITKADITKYINAGIRKAEQVIHTLYEDYFLNEAILPITSGNSLVDYPSDIYANKIRSIVYNNGSGGSTSSHVVRKLRSLVEGTEMDLYENSTNTVLRWSPVNDPTEGRKIRLFPMSGRTGVLRVWYIRNAKQLVADTDICDIDEFEDYVIQHAKTRCYSKDGDPRTEESLALEEQIKSDMVNTLSDMVPDGDDELERDVSLYEDMVGDNL